jgi:HD-GYP domain-containing protein (c-di-GMP phosphodiesterase class II)
LERTLALSTAYRGTALLLGDIVEADDHYTGIHSRDVVDLSLAVAEALGLDAAQRCDVELGALLHDVGMLRQVGRTLASVRRIVRPSHEPYDGLGYLDGLAGEEIPIAGRIVCACDAYSAMTIDRA